MSSRIADPVVQALHDAPRRFELFAALRLLEQAVLRDGPKDAEEIGVSRDFVRISASPELGFQGSEVSGFNPGHEAQLPELTTTLPSFFGRLGALPQHYSELVLRTPRAEIEPMCAFFDLFHHRLCLLLYAQWTRCRLPVAFERAERQRSKPAEDPADFDDVSACMLALLGFAERGLLGRDGLPRAGLLYGGGLLIGHSRSADGLELFISQRFGVPVRVKPFAPLSYELPESDQLRLGHRNHVLGQAQLGRSVSCDHGRFILALGPMRGADFLRLLPHAPGGGLSRLSGLLRLYAGPALRCDLELSVAGDDVPICRLGDRSERAPRLGHSVWLRPRAEKDAYTIRIPLTDIEHTWRTE